MDHYNPNYHPSPYHTPNRGSNLLQYGTPTSNVAPAPANGVSAGVPPHGIPPGAPNAVLYCGNEAGEAPFVLPFAATPSLEQIFERNEYLRLTLKLNSANPEDVTNAQRTFVATFKSLYSDHETEGEAYEKVETLRSECTALSAYFEERGRELANVRQNRRNAMATLQHQIDSHRRMDTLEQEEEDKFLRGKEYCAAGKEFAENVRDASRGRRPGTITAQTLKALENGQQWKRTHVDPSMIVEAFGVDFFRNFDVDESYIFLSFMDKMGCALNTEFKKNIHANLDLVAPGFWKNHIYHSKEYSLEVSHRVSCTSSSCNRFSPFLLFLLPFTEQSSASQYLFQRGSTCRPTRQ